MVAALREWWQSRERGPIVRPWGLAAPILVLLVCLPLLRPLRHPESISENECARLATIEAIVEKRTLAIDGTQFPVSEKQITMGGRGGERNYSQQPPVMAALLAGPYWLMHKLGLSFDSNPTISAYLLTLIGATLPVAGAAGLVYRMGRLFELPRHWRMILAIAAVFGSGLVSYATVLNSHAPAAFFVLAACGCFFHAGLTKRVVQSFAWLGLAGLCAAFAATIDMAALVYLVLLMAIIPAMRWPWTSRISGLLWYVGGAVGPLLLHAALTVPITGDVRPGFLHPELAAAPGAPPVILADADEEDDEYYTSYGETVILRLVDGLLGPHGLLSHFPILLIGIGGIGAVLHRHWPLPTKVLAMVSLFAAIAIVIAYVTLRVNWNQPMFAVRWFIVFMPLLVYWCGAWLRKSHSALMWTGAALLLLFSILTTVLGATAPFSESHGKHTAYAAARQLFRPSVPAQQPRNEQVAER
jgi:hypothetical protein